MIHMENLITRMIPDHSFFLSDSEPKYMYSTISPHAETTLCRTLICIALAFVLA